MPFQLGGSSARDSISRRQPPPDVSSRQTWWRLFLVVAAVMIGVGLVSKAFDARTWQLLGFTQRPIAGGTPLAQAEGYDGHVDSRLYPKPAAEESDAIRVAVDTAPSSTAVTADVTEQSATGGEPGEPGDRSATDSAALAERMTASWRDAWAALLRDIPNSSETQLFARLRAARKRSPSLAPTADQAGDWRRQVDSWHGQWQAYIAAARLSLDSLPPEEQASWTKVLDATNESWTQRWRPLVAQLGESPADAVQVESEREEDPKLVELLQELADQNALRSVQDDTVWRSNETNIWFRMIDRLRELDADQLRRLSRGPTGYLPLFKQPDVHRGQIVTVRGVVKLAYRVDAPTNHYGVREYTLLWIYPAGGPDSPLVVYALETPAGFPPIKHRDRDRDTSKLHEEVEVTGYFFKRWAYESREGIHVAPLLVAHSPRWQPLHNSSDEAPSGGTIGAIVLASAVLGVGAALLVFRNTRRK